MPVENTNTNERHMEGHRPISSDECIEYSIIRISYFVESELIRKKLLKWSSFSKLVVKEHHPISVTYINKAEQFTVPASITTTQGFYGLKMMQTNFVTTCRNLEWNV